MSHYTSVSRKDFTLWERNVMANVHNRKRSLSYAPAAFPSGTFNTAWDDGSRDAYWWADRHGRVLDVISHQPNPPLCNDPFNQAREFSAPPEGTIALVQGGTFCGKQSYLRITLFPPLSRGDLS